MDDPRHETMGSGSDLVGSYLVILVTLPRLCLLLPTSLQLRLGQLVRLQMRMFHGKTFSFPQMISLRGTLSLFGWICRRHRTGTCRNSEHHIQLDTHL